MPTRPVLDRCPGVLRPFAAADGALVRLRIPGGRTSTSELADIMSLAERHGAPFLQLTSRSNLQVRGLPETLPGAFVAGVTALGLLPSETHERVRNVVADPSPELDAFVTRLDERIQQEPGLARLPGRWLFAVADHSGGVLNAPYDVAYQAVSATRGRLLIGERTAPCAPDEAVDALIRLALRFLEVRQDEGVWHLSDLPFDSSVFDGFDTAEPLGPVTPPQPAFELGVPLGLCTPDLTAALLETLGEDADIVITPHRSLVFRERLTRGQADALLAAGFAAAHDPARALTACIGAPFCHRTTSPTVRIARELPTVQDLSRTHLAGCERACGRPKSAHTLVVAPKTPDDVLDAIGTP